MKHTNYNFKNIAETIVCLDNQIKAIPNEFGHKIGFKMRINYCVKDKIDVVDTIELFIYEDIIH